jgi:thiamine kinase-like enzyme
VRIIDWEYCGYGDGLFDLAHIANSAAMTFEEEKYMLEVYFGYFETEMWEMLKQMKYISDVYNATWPIFLACMADSADSKIGYIEKARKMINLLTD